MCRIFLDSQEKDFYETGIIFSAKVTHWRNKDNLEADGKLNNCTTSKLHMLGSELIAQPYALSLEVLGAVFLELVVHIVILV